MYSVYYPISQFDEQSVGSPSIAFKKYDSNDPKEAAEILKILVMQFGSGNIRIYDMSTTDYSSRYPNINDMANDFNNEELDSNVYWCVILNLSEKEVMDICRYSSRDFVIVENNKPITFSDNEMVCYGDFDEAVCDADEGKIIGILTYDTDEEGKQRVEFFNMAFENVESFAYCDVSEQSWNRDCYEAVCEFNGDFSIAVM